MLAAAINKAGALDMNKVAGALEDMKWTVFNGGDGVMRKDDHQFFQPMYIFSIGERGPNETFDEEGTGWGWRTVAKLIDGLPLIEPREIELFEQCTGRKYNRQARRAVRRLILLAGRRAGKDRFLSAVAVWRAAFAPIGASTSAPARAR